MSALRAMHVWCTSVKPLSTTNINNMSILTSKNDVALSVTLSLTNSMAGQTLINIDMENREKRAQIVN